MRFLVDACAGTGVAGHLAQAGHDVAFVGPSHLGLPDIEVLAWADREVRILITCDKDFGDLVFRRHLGHAGVVLLRLDDERIAVKCAVLDEVLLRLAPERFSGAFITASEHHLRITLHP